VGRFHGVGPVTEKRLRDAGIHTGGDLHRAGAEAMSLLLGRTGRFLWSLSDGVDDRPVEADRERKSVGVEDTFLVTAGGMEGLTPCDPGIVTL
jgi:DNA polymerase-4